MVVNKNMNQEFTDLNNLLLGRFLIQNKSIIGYRPFAELWMRGF